MGSTEHDLIKIFEDVCTWDKARLSRWTNVAKRWLNIYGNRTYERHWTPADIIKEVMARVLEKKRIYNPLKYKNVDHFVYLTIKSIIDDEFKARKSVLPAEKNIDSNDGSDFINIYEQQHKIEKDYIENTFDVKEKFDKCYQQILKKNEDDALLLLYWKDGMTSQDLADDLGIEKSEVESAKKRIRYTLTGKK